MISSSVHSRKELAAAIRAIPHDEACQITLHRKDGNLSVWSFDFTKGDRVYAPDHSGNRVIKTTATINSRLQHLAQRVMKTPEEVL